MYSNLLETKPQIHTGWVGGVLARSLGFGRRGQVEVEMAGERKLQIKSCLNFTSMDD